MSYLRHPGLPPETDLIPAKHPSIVQAICQVMATMATVKKSARNQHGGYDYASADDIYASVTRRMAEAGLIIDVLEVDKPETMESGKGARWAKITFQFVLSTAEATWTHPAARRTIMLPLNGPQSFMAAQSYAEKSYLRSLFKIPTGEMELDEIYTPMDEAGNIKISPAAAKRANVWEKAQEAISSCEDMTALLEVDSQFRKQIPKQWKEAFSDLLVRRQEQLSGELI